MTIIEYASLTCSHCANFHKTTYPELKKRYIDTNKVRFILREFPLDPLATAGFMLARCDGEAKYYPITDLLFEQQKNWAFTEKPLDALRQLMRQAGFSQEKFEACLQDQKLYDAVNAVKNRASRCSRWTRPRPSSSMASVIPEAFRSMRSRRSSSLCWESNLSAPALAGRGRRAASMKLTRLRIVGFKTFVEPTDFLIETGLTGVVGPNGCGKSNLVEALRWVMGENSHKNMRASGMDDVIFSGSGGRPARNTAEVMLTIDNGDRTAPAAFNDADVLEVSRRIEREEGSTYRINGKEVRARDVQILFADAATGARSPSLVRQGQISEIISAKPQARRRILEDAAGIAGPARPPPRGGTAPQGRRGQSRCASRTCCVSSETQIDSLKRQGRQASRYKNLSAEIRRLEALLFAIGFADAREQAASAERQAAEDLKAVADRTEEQTRAATAQAIAAHGLPALREAEVKAAAALQRLTHARNELESEERRVEGARHRTRTPYRRPQPRSRPRGGAARGRAGLDRAPAGGSG